MVEGNIFLIYMGFLFFYLLLLLQEVKTRQGVYLSERERQRDYGIGPAQARSILVVFLFLASDITPFTSCTGLFRVQKCVCVFILLHFPLFSFLFLSLSHYEEIPIVYNELLDQF